MSRALRTGKGWRLYGIHLFWWVASKDGSGPDPGLTDPGLFGTGTDGSKLSGPDPIPDPNFRDRDRIRIQTSGPDPDPDPNFVFFRDRIRIQISDPSFGTKNFFLECEKYWWILPDSSEIIFKNTTLLLWYEVGMFQDYSRSIVFWPLKIFKNCL